MAYSTQFKSYEGELSDQLRQVLAEIKSYFGLDEIPVLQYDETHILVLVTIDVPLPPQGTIGGIDIRPKEPCLMRISLVGYPDESPVVSSDREDFPSQFLGHLYVAKNANMPGPFCLVRNDPHEWFANRSISGLLDVTQQWLFKAAIGRLNEDGDEFDPTRLEGYRGYHIYKYETVRDIIVNDNRLTPAQPFAVMMACGYLNDGQVTYKSINHIPFIQLEKTRDLISQISEKLTDDDLAKPLLSLVVWSDGSPVETEYCTSIPDTYATLKIYFQVRGIDIDEILKAFSKAGLHLLNAIPVIHAIRRPNKMIGYDSEYEFINFQLQAKTNNNGKFSDDSVVKNQSHTEPFSKGLAKELSGDDRSIPTLYIGGGSLGSKLFTHELRSGNIEVGVVDQDELMQHNLVRHELFSESVGKNKAQALIKKAENFFALDKVGEFRSYPYRIHHVKKEDLDRYVRIIDSTASLAVQNWLAKKTFANVPVIIRTELVHQGQLGLAYIEGDNRNPRIDDLVNITYYLAVNNPVLKRWRRFDSSAELMNLNIGLGCSSPTTVMADDTISFHASVFSRLIQNFPSDPQHKGEGLLYRSILENKSIPVLSSETEYMKPFEVYPCGEGSGWEIRFIHGSTERFFDLCRRKGRVETGGILIGMANSKTKTIHVFDIITEPQDSKGTCTGFIRGIKGIPALVDRIKELTGDMVGYIGEWHTHPMDLERLSGVDRSTIAELRVINRRVPIPTLAVVVTTNKVLPFVFD